MNDALTGIVKAPRLDGDSFISELVRDVKAIVDIYTDNEVALLALEEVAVLYASEQSRDVIVATLDLDLDAIVDSLGNVLAVALAKYAPVVRAS